MESIKGELQLNNGIITNLYTGSDGREELLKSLSNKDINVIHLATHGFFWSKSEANEQKGITALVQNKDRNTSALLRSGILMAGANHALKGETLPKNIEDGIVTALEISTQNYRTVDMVVLSACQSGQGDVTSEGLYGLQRAFKKAGVGTMVMALWRISDKVTTELMIAFYERLSENNWDKRKAFDDAKSIIREQYPDPYYWAAFVMLD